MRLLIIEDQPQVSAALKAGLQTLYLADVARSGEAATEAWRTHSYDLILLDLKLPDGDGRDFCREWRTMGLSAPILIISGETDVNGKAQALDAGADDYLTKPFNLVELKARLRALLRRRTASLTSSKIHSGPLTLDTATCSVTYQDQPLPLRRKEFLILEYLLRQPGTVVTQEMIVSQVWGQSVGLNTNSVAVHIKTLRQKLDAINMNHIQTVYGFGYKWLATPA